MLHLLIRAARTYGRYEELPPHRGPRTCRVTQSDVPELVSATALLSFPTELEVPSRFHVSCGSCVTLPLAFLPNQTVTDLRTP
jgi:hypothetical protein